MKVLILGAGYGTRLQRDLIHAEEYRHLRGIPKALLPLGDRDALITYWLQLFKEYGIGEDDIYIVTNDTCYPYFEAWAQRHEVSLGNIVSDGTTTNDTRLGAVPDISFALHHFHLNHDDILIVGGDTLLLDDFSLDAFLSRVPTGPCLVATYTVSDDQVSKVGIVETNPEGLITSFLEKPDPSQTTSRLACPCFYLLRRDALKYIDEFIALCQANHEPKEAYDATGKLLSYLYPRFPILTFPIAGRIDVGNLQSYIEAHHYLLNK
ncbi:nucleotide-diphospho-sugar transferase [Radiomyces spectabilis]|uniref:nucleotide-diphospho-sugar transferase n=1 Tax=Radiomyces spectabilis TaxID=64574 RepID=UPI00221F9CBE|nr:nucleotide-diphospho-sugar transferase [Radiomyces spectabilis]KAI8371645.1 nucleotide-diphospho-sugar transferase [Radiomyces spectabilis]